MLTFVLAMLISAVMSFLSGRLLGAASSAVSFLVLIGIILIGVVFDMIGVAVTSAQEAPFHSMASRKLPGAAEALTLLRNAGRVSSFCNDVIGDICGVVSGAAAAAIAVRAAVGSGQTVYELILSALVAAFTIGGKAFGKSFAIGYCTEIVHITAKILYFFKNIPTALRKRRK